jgi:hypothetical protein
LIFLAGCGTMKMQSNWRENEIEIDGSQTDWKGALTFLEKKNLSFGFMNDDHYLYACLVTGDPMLQSKILRMGFTIWFDATGGKDKKYGIRFPIGFNPDELRQIPGPSTG